MNGPYRYVLRSPVRWAAKSLIEHRWKVTVNDTHFPRSGPVIVAANHIGVLDGPLLAILGPRPLHALTKSEMFHGAGGAFLRHSGQISVERFRPDRAAVRQALEVLERGDALGIFPEGTRGTGTFDEVQNGAAYLAMVTGVPIVPAVFLGTRTAGMASGWIPPRGAEIELSFGAPIAVDQVNWPRTRENVAAESRRVQTHLKAHLAATLAESAQILPGPLPEPEDD